MAALIARASLPRAVHPAPPLLPIVLALILWGTDEWGDGVGVWGGIIEEWAGEEELWGQVELRWGTDE